MLKGRKFLTFGEVGDIKRGTGEMIRIGDLLIAVFNCDGALFATQEHCTCDGGSLSEGHLSGSVIECPSDGAQYYIPTGECLNPRGKKNLVSYKLRIEGDEIKIDLTKLFRPRPKGFPLPAAVSVRTGPFA